MNTEPETTSSLFEIDQPEHFQEYFLTRPLEVVSCLKNLQKRQSIITVYIGSGADFFISSILALEETGQRIVLDAANSEKLRHQAKQSSQLTLTTILDKVKIQIRTPQPTEFIHEGKPALAIQIPSKILRLQRREYYRLELADATPVICKLAHHKEDDTTTILNLRLLDISEGGVSLRAALKQAEYFPAGQLFQDCRLEIPGEGFIPVHLCVKKTSTIASGNDSPLIRIGCEFVNLPGNRMAQIQRYITRSERVQKARSIQ